MISRKFDLPKKCRKLECPNGEFKNVQTMLETIMRINCRTFRLDDEASGCNKGVKCMWRNGATVDTLMPDIPHHECILLGIKNPEKIEIIAGQYVVGGRRI